MARLRVRHQQCRHPITIETKSAGFPSLLARSRPARRPPSPTPPSKQQQHSLHRARPLTVVLWCTRGLESARRANSILSSEVPRLNVATMDDTPDAAIPRVDSISSPILGDQLKQVFEETNLQSPLTTADKLEGMADELEDKLNEKARQQAKRCWQLNFSEPAIEASSL